MRELFRMHSPTERVKNCTNVNSFAEAVHPRVENRRNSTYSAPVIMNTLEQAMKKALFAVIW